MKKTISSKVKTKKFTLVLPVPLYEDIKAQANSVGNSVTAEIISLCRQGLNESKAINTLPTLLEQLLNEQKRTKNPKK